MVLRRKEKLMCGNRCGEEKKKSIFIYVTVFFLISVAVFTGMSGLLCPKAQETDTERLCRTSIFSWDGAYMELSQESRLSQAMAVLGCGAIYQEIPEDAGEMMVLDFLERRHEQGQDVYYLAGASSWAIEADGASMVRQVKRAAKWNKKAGKKGFAGVVLDVEPYLLDEWDEEREAVMSLYVKNCEKAYREASENGLALILCIPNFYDGVGDGTYLEQLVLNGCDAIAVMNYNKKDEAGQIAYEHRLAEEYGKGLINITELQKPGRHELTEENTYYYDGIEGVLESWDALRAAFPEREPGFSWHYLNTALEIIERGE